MYRTLLTLAAFVVSAWAQSNDNPFNVPPGFALTAGKPTTLTWKPTTGGTVTLQLRQGPANNLDEGTTIESNIPNTGSYTYTPDPNTVRGSDYTIEIISDSDPKATNYSPYFVLESSNTVASQTADSLSASGTPNPSSASSASSDSATTSPASDSATTSPASSAAASSDASSSAAASSAAASSSASSATAAASGPSSKTASPSFSSRSAAAHSTVAKASAAATNVAAGGASSGQESSPAVLGSVPAWKIQGGLFAVFMGAMAA
ncbi:hypothetical protein G7Y79_00036g072260 [Physcia stellaris]|nr:hypothetical protein G7Y79_00036g072260 [Physcia stellaris]